jgi:hypothetical protein
MGMTMLPDESTVLLTSQQEMAGSSLLQSSASSIVDTSSQVEGASQGQAITRSQVQARHQMQGISMASQRGHSDALTQGTSKTTTRGRTPSFTEEESEGSTETTGPFYEYAKRRVVSSRTFLNKEEFLILGMQRINVQGKAHFLLKVPDKLAVFFRTGRADDPYLRQRDRAQGYQRIFTQPSYATVETIDAEETERQERLLSPPPSAKPPSRKTSNRF